MRAGAALLSCAAAAAADTAPGAGDLARGRQRVPRDGWRGADFGAAMRKLNLHLRFDPALRTARCGELPLGDVVAAQRALLLRRSEELGAVYPASDRRALPAWLASGAAGFDADAADEAALLAGAGDGERAELTAAARNARCHWAVMLYAHHLTHAARGDARRGGLLLPLLPEESARVGGSAAAERVARRLTEAQGCTACHVDPSLKPTPAPNGTAPHWPPPVLPVWPMQFVASLTGYTNKSGDNPPGPFVRDTGVWYYDFANGRFRADYINTYPDGSVQNHSQLWLPALPSPNFFLFITANGTTTCEAQDFSGFLGLLRPDCFAAANATWTDRIQLRGEWVDVWDGRPGGVLYEDIMRNQPACDGDCLTTDGQAAFWEPLRVEAPPAWAYTRDVSGCQKRKGGGTPASSNGLLNPRWTALLHAQQHNV